MKKTLLCLFLLCCTVISRAGITVEGYVRDDKGTPLSGVKVTDGHNIVRTAADGLYSFDLHDDAAFVYISIPSGFDCLGRNGAPLFYHRIDRSAAEQRYNFDLVRSVRDQNRHQFYVWADVQVYREKEVEYVKQAAADAKAYSASCGLPAFGISCGDIVGESDSGLMASVHKACSEAGFPFFALMGNHDYRPGASNEESKELYQSLFGPNYYSFDRGRVHYVVLDDVFYYSRHYMGYIEHAQLEWLKKDLKDLPEGSSVVLFMHIPTYSRQAEAGDFKSEGINKIVTNRDALYDILKPFNCHICSAHEHYAENYQIADNLMEHVHAPLSGLFWQSLYSCDGLPWGYYVYDVDGDNITWQYKAVGMDPQVQFSAYRVGEDPLKPECIVANVWNYDPSWKVEWKENGVLQGEMTRYSGWDHNIVADVDARREKEFTWKSIGAGETRHLFCATPSRADSDIEILVTDRFGRVYTWSNSRQDIYSTGSYTLTSEKLVEAGEQYYAPACVQHPLYGSYIGVNRMETALYELAIDEMVRNIEEDGTFRTGELWSGVWTRDVSYSAILSLAHLEPEVVKTSLMRKVDKKNRIIQDTGTGGSWPCSSDRVVWAIAAWQVYLQTGDLQWLKQVYPIIKRSIEADLVSVYDSETGLFRGESSFIDWREQSYPAWMQPVDISQSECLGTNAVYYRALQCLSLMAGKLGVSRANEAKRFESLAEDLKDAINHYFWMEKEGYYAQFIYGRNAKVLSPRSETLGESLCVLWDIASPSQAMRIIESMPVCDFGPTIFSPQISAISSYHNNAIWPFVTSFYGMAAARTGNTSAVAHALASNSRAALRFGSNQENMVASTGGKETALNSPRQLWSVAGYIGLCHNALLGINYEDEGIRFSPCVPGTMGSNRQLEGLKYRNMTLDIEIVGTGCEIRDFLLDGTKSSAPFVPASLEGRHKVKIILASSASQSQDKINLLPVQWDLDVPAVTLTAGELVWQSVKGADSYKILCDGVVVDQTQSLTYRPAIPGEYAVIATSASGAYSFMSEPLRFNLKEQLVPVEMPVGGKLGSQLKIDIEVPHDGNYVLDIEYSNGNGNITTFNKCATRTIYIDRKKVDVAVFPQRGDSWDDRGWSNPVKVELSQGKHSLELRYLEENVNMNIDIDAAIIHNVRITEQ